MRTRYLRILIGLSVWIVLGGAAYLGLQDSERLANEKGRRVAADLWEFATAERRVVKLRYPAHWPLQVGDPIYRIDGPERIEQVGEVRWVESRERAESRAAGDAEQVERMAEALLYPHAPAPTQRSYMTYYTTPRSLTWVLDTMLSPEKQARIAEEILWVYESFSSEILEALKPVVVGGFLDAVEVVEGDLTAALHRHREPLEELATRYQTQVVEEEIVPLVREEIWPVVQRRAEPLANKIGKEMFERASLWRFGWRALYDKSFLPDKDLTQQEWNRYLREEGLPVLDRHRDEIVALQKRILEDLAESQPVREALEENLMLVVDDPEFREIVWKIFREVLVDNPRLRARLEQRWNTLEARRAVQLAANYVEPCVRRIGDLLFGTREHGIAPEFAQVLRNQILDKDCRWLVMHAPGVEKAGDDKLADRPLPVRGGGTPEVNPFAAQLQGVR